MTTEPAGPTSWTITPEHLELARRAVDAHALRTPLVPGPAFGGGVWLKQENRQTTGSFKVRGALTRLVARTADERERPLVVASAGNHGLGMAHAARKLGGRLKVWVPSVAPEVKRAGIRALGAELVVSEEASYDAMEAQARAAAEADGALFLSPFDDPWVAAGNGGTVAQEIFEQMSPVTVVVPVGGGGLLAGVVAARDAAGSRARVVGVELESCPSMAESLRRGEAVTSMAGGPTRAEGLEGGVCASTLAYAQRDGVEIVSVSEEALVDAMVRAERFGERVEGSAAAALAWAAAKPTSDEGATVVVVSGGNA